MLTKSMKTSDLIEPVGKYISVLLEIGKIQSPGCYTYDQISEIIRENQEPFDTIYHDTERCDAVCLRYARQVKEIFIISKEFLHFG